MQFDQTRFAVVVAQAKAAASNSPRWIRAIEKAAEALMNGELIVTVLAHGAIVTSQRGTYHTNGHCDCAAARNGHAQCYHRAGVRLVEMYEEAIYAPKTETKPEPKPERKPTAPKITRSIERNHNGPHFQTVRIDGWRI